MIRLAFKPAAVNWGQNSFAWKFWHAACYFLTLTFYKCPNNWVCLYHCWWKYRCRTKEVKTPMFKLWDCSTFDQITIKSSCRKNCGIATVWNENRMNIIGKKICRPSIATMKTSAQWSEKKKKDDYFWAPFLGALICVLPRFRIWVRGILRFKRFCCFWEKKYELHFLALVGCWHSTEVAFAILTQLTRVRFLISTACWVSGQWQLIKPVPSYMKLWGIPVESQVLSYKNLSSLGCSGLRKSSVSSHE